MNHRGDCCNSPGGRGDEGMDEGFRSCEGWTEAGDVPEVKEGCLSDVLYVLFEREGLVEDDAKITDVRGGGYCGAVDI